MNIEEVREIGLSLPHTTERCPYGPDYLVLEIGGKQFCLLDLTGQNDFYNLKVDPDYSLELRDRYAGIRPGWHMNKKHWISVDYSGDVPDGVQRELIGHAYRQTAKGLSKKVRQTLGLLP
ncbi:MAG: MmcQ/YjbR family DNA-binding protein [Bacteroidales bacterium]|nr:MmcQ/YjbR family DNA-binding protein [Bacteroidales bacterium]